MKPSESDAESLIEQLHTARPQDLPAIYRHVMSRACVMPHNVLVLLLERIGEAGLLTVLDDNAEKTRQAKLNLCALYDAELREWELLQDPSINYEADKDKAYLKDIKTERQLMINMLKRLHGGDKHERKTLPAYVLGLLPSPTDKATKVKGTYDESYDKFNKVYKAYLNNPSLLDNKTKQRKTKYKADKKISNSWAKAFETVKKEKSQVIE